MTVIQKTIGRLPVNLGDYDTTRAYGKKNRVLLYGCEWESKVNNNTYAPATLNTTTGVITPDTTHWKLINGSYNTWLIDNGYKKADANNVKDGDLTQHEINEAVSGEIGDDSTPASIKGRIKTLETNVGEGGSVDERIAAEGAQHYLKSETYTKSEVNGMITTPDQEYVTVTATDQTTAVTDVLPATGEPDTVYRVGNWDGNQYDATVYSEYAWNESTSQYIHLRTKTQIGEVFDISSYHATGGTLATYSDLNDALNGVNGGVPQSLQKGGMSVKFVLTSDNKYIQARLMADSFTTDITQWQGVDTEVIAGSKNLVESGAIKIAQTKASKLVNYQINLWSQRYIDDNGALAYKSGTSVSLPILLHKGDTIICQTNTNGNSPIYKVTLPSLAFVGVVNGKSTLSKYYYTANKDCFVSVYGYNDPGIEVQLIRQYSSLDERIYNTSKGLLRDTVALVAGTDFTLINSRVISKEGTVSYNSSYNITSPIHLNAGETLNVSAANNGSYVLWLTDSSASYYVGQLNLSLSGTDLHNYTYYAHEECYIAICYNTSQPLTVTKDSYTAGVKQKDVVNELGTDEQKVPSQKLLNQNIGKQITTTEVTVSTKGSTAIDDSGNITTIYGYYVTNPILLKKGQIINVRIRNMAYNCLWKTNIGLTTFVALLGRSAGESEEHYTATEDMYVILCGRVGSDLSITITAIDNCISNNNDEYSPRYTKNITYKVLFGQNVGSIRADGTVDTGLTHYRYTKPIHILKGETINAVCINNGLPALFKTDATGSSYTKLLWEGIGDSELTEHKLTFSEDCYIAISYRNTEGCTCYLTSEQNTTENEQTGNSLFAIHGFNECYDKISQITLGNSTGDGNQDATKCLSLLVFTDIHGDIDNIHRIKDFEDCFSTMITDTIQLGDLVRTNIEDFPDLNWAANGMSNVLNVLGNHDAWSRDSSKGEPIAPGATTYLVNAKDCYDRFISPFVSLWGVTQPTGAAENGYCYYYKDYAELGIRVIVLDVMHWDATQKSWFADTLDDARQNGYSVVGMQHYPAGLHTALDCSFVDPYVSISERTDSYVQVDEFINNGGEFICWLSGHYHTDLFGLITTDERQVELNLDTSGCNNRTHIAKHIKGTLSQDSFNIVSFDTTRKLIRLWRIGRNYDRLTRFKEMFCYDYANHVIISK